MNATNVLVKRMNEIWTKTSRSTLAISCLLAVFEVKYQFVADLLFHASTLVRSQPEFERSAIHKNVKEFLAFLHFRSDISVPTEGLRHQSNEKRRSSMTSHHNSPNPSGNSGKEQTESKCATCSMRLNAQKNPRSFGARLWRWHTKWCPGWKAYLKELNNKGLPAPKL